MLLRQEPKQNREAGGLSLLKKLTMLTFFLSPFNLALGQAPPSPLNTKNPIVEDVIQESVPEVILQKKNSFFKLQVSEDIAYELLYEPDLEQMKKSLGLVMPEKLKAELLARGEKFEDPNPLAGYQDLSADEQKKFHEARLEFLKNAARIFNSTKFALGFGSLIGHSFSFIKEKILTTTGQYKTISENLSFKQRSHQVTQNLLQSLDYKLWSQAPLLIASNEYGVSLSLGVSAARGFLQNGVGGAEELGISLGYNKQSRAFVFEIFHNSEKFKTAHAPIAMIGMPYKFGTFITRRNLAFKTAHMRGESFYPPAIPGFASSGSDFFVGGINSSISLPPSPFVDLMTFTNEFDRNSILRITISPLVKGFVRMQFGDINGSIVLITARVTQIANYVYQSVRLSRAPNCSAVFI